MARLRGGGGKPRILDFGCGCGRLLRFLTRHDGLFELHGTDVNAEHVEWCRRALAPIAFALNAPLPPLSYATAFFDGVWSLSVFSHLDAEREAAWRDELARVLVPGGVLIATTHGPTALDRIADEPALAAAVRLDRARVEELRARLTTTGFAYVPYDIDVLDAAKAGDSYGLAFFSADGLTRRWNDERFEVRAHLPGALRGWQDVVVLRRR